jgi:HK97 family phage prohead protease
MKTLLYSPFEKVEDQDDGTVKVFGIASSETEDSDGEIVKSDAMRAALPDWLEYGNIREMHQPIAAGVAIEAHVDDAGVTHLGAHIVDASTVQKVKAGVLKGFSIGGNVVKRDKANKKIITAINISEISAVDRPANPDARISLVKLDKDGRAVSKVAERSDVKPSEGEDKYGDVEFADAKNKKYPIDTAAHVRAAWNYINKPKNAGKYSSSDLATIKRKIVAAWKDKIDADGPPSASEKTMKIGELQKGMYGISHLAQLIESIHWLQTSAEYERSAEGDDSEVPDDIKAWCAQGCTILRDMVSEETAELLGLDDEEGDMLENAAKKIADGDLAKAGAKFSKETRERMEAVQAHAEKLHKAAEKCMKMAGEHTEMCDKMFGGDDDEGGDDEKPKEKARKAVTIVGGDEEVDTEECVDALVKTVKKLTARLEKAESEKTTIATQAMELAEQVMTKAKGNLRVVGKEGDVIGKGQVDDDDVDASKVDLNDEKACQAAFAKSLKAAQRTPIEIDRRKVG